MAVAGDGGVLDVLVVASEVVNPDGHLEGGPSVSGAGGVEVPVVVVELVPPQHVYPAGSVHADIRLRHVLG
jgi:hypothetical protein